MVTISPIKALRPEAQHARHVASPPYDVLNSREAKVAAQGNPISFLHITKSEIDLPETLDIHSFKVYEAAKQNLDAFMSRNILFRESKPCLYIYRLTMNGRAQTGLVCGSSVDDYDNDLIRKHEFTRPDKEQDRINHILTTSAQTGNVFLAYRQVAEIDALVDSWMKQKQPVYDFQTEDGVGHAIWIINDDDTIGKLVRMFREKVPCTYIADGHHRAASAAKARLQLGAATTASANIFLTTLFPSNQLHIMDYNRVIKDLNGHTPADFLRALEQNFIVAPVDAAFLPEVPHVFGMYLDRKWYRLTARKDTFDAVDPIGRLDVSILQKNVLEPLLGIADQRTDKRIDFVGGIRGLAELERRVDSGEMALAFSIHPVSIDQLFAVADSGQVMPPKSTWFEPKLRDGLLTHLISD
jgi:uncharacterized protein (DUF1015 family)